MLRGRGDVLGGNDKMGSITPGSMLACNERYGLPFCTTDGVLGPIPGRDTVLSEGLYFLSHTHTAALHVFLLCSSRFEALQTQDSSSGGSGVPSSCIGSRLSEGWMLLSNEMLVSFFFSSSFLSTPSTSPPVPLNVAFKSLLPGAVLAGPRKG